MRTAMAADRGRVGGGTKKPHFRLHVTLGTHSGPWWWVEYPNGETSGFIGPTDTRVVAPLCVNWIAMDDLRRVM